MLVLIILLLFVDITSLIKMYEQLLCHLTGDYLLQTKWMAQNKEKNIKAALFHCVTYTVPFVFITQNIVCLFLIFFLHLVVDYTGVVKKISNNKMGNSPDYLKSFVAIARDNTVHLLINYFILR